MRNKMTFHISAFLAVALSCVSIAQASPSKDYDGYNERYKDSYKRDQLVDRVLSRGAFDCSVDIIEPNGGTGEPRLSAFVSFGQQLNLTGAADAFFGLDSGSKDELDKICQEFTESLFSTAEDVGCTAGPIRTERFVGGNFVSDSWRFDIICNGDRNRVVNAVGVLVEEVILAIEPEQATTQEKSTWRDSMTWEQFQLMRGQANGSSPLMMPDSSSESR